MKCSLCIPTYKRPETLNMLLSSIIGMNDNRIAEILIGISYKEELSINKNTKHLLRILEIQNIPYFMCSNLNGLLAAKKWFKTKASQDILLIVDDDCIINKNYLNLLNFFDSATVVAISGSLQTPLNINYYKDYSYEPIEAPSNKILCNKIQVDNNGLVIIKDKYQVYMLNKSLLYKCECLIGTAMFIRKNCLKIDENYNNGACNYEEIDYTYSLYKQGKILLFYSGEIAFHLHENIGGMREAESKQKKENSDYFKRKHDL